MKAVFVSNKMTPHVLPISNVLDCACEGKYDFIETLGDDRELPVGWQFQGTCAYIVSPEIYRANETVYRKRILEADVVIWGAAPDHMVEDRLTKRKLTFRYAERFYKNGTPLKNWLRDCLSAWLHHGRFQKYPLYMLSASAYTAADAARFGNYKNRCFRWGYFPETRVYETSLWETEKKQDVQTILWAGRLIDWKHPDDAVQAAEKLKKSGYHFRMKLIGSGPMEEQLQQMIEEKDLTDCVELLGTKTPEEVRSCMEQANIYLFTSDFGEGWGAVLNESMNSACAVVVSHAVGAAPFLVKDGENGCIYRSGDVDMLAEKVKKLLDNPAEQRRLGEAAYATIVKTWNAEEAAKRLLVLVDCIQKGEETPFLDGPCSRAPIYKDNWF